MLIIAIMTMFVILGLLSVVTIDYSHTLVTILIYVLIIISVLLLVHHN